MKLAFVFRHCPHGNSVGREGLDTLLAATAFCHEEDITVFFMDDGVVNLLPNQQPERILQKDFIRALKLLDLYDIRHRYVCKQSLQRLHLTQLKPVIACEQIERAELLEKIRQVEKCLVF